MERLEAKQVNGHTYYYYSQWARKDGRCRRIWQKYLGKLEDIVQAVEGGPAPPTAPKCFNGACRKRCGERCAARNSSRSSTRSAARENRGSPSGNIWPLPPSTGLSAPKASDPCGVGFLKPSYCGTSPTSRNRDSVRNGFGITWTASMLMRQRGHLEDLPGRCHRSRTDRRFFDQL